MCDAFYSKYTQMNGFLSLYLLPWESTSLLLPVQSGFCSSFERAERQCEAGPAKTTLVFSHPGNSEVSLISFSPRSNLIRKHSTTFRGYQMIQWDFPNHSLRSPQHLICYQMIYHVFSRKCHCMLLRKWEWKVKYLTMIKVFFDLQTMKGT